MRVKNWRKFQHYKHRDPPWIRLYRNLLNDREWHNLDGDAAKRLIMIWLIASECEGQLPSLKDLAFRLRLTEKETSSTLSKLSHWLEQDDSTMLAECGQDAPSETETETETETEEKERSLRSRDDDWPPDYRERFWKAYPRKQGRKPALLILEKIRKRGEASFDRVMAGIKTIKTDDQKFIPHATTWLNQARWDDEPLEERNGSSSAVIDASDRLIEKIKSFSGPPAICGGEGTTAVRLLQEGRSERSRDVYSGGDGDPGGLPAGCDLPRH